MQKQRFLPDLRLFFSTSIGRTIGVAKPVRAEVKMILRPEERGLD
jgi:hypothetical protein